MMKKYIFHFLITVTMLVFLPSVKACQDTVLLQPIYSFDNGELVVELYQTQKSNLLGLQAGFLFDRNVLLFKELMVMETEAELSMLNMLPDRILLSYVENSSIAIAVDISKPLITLRFIIIDPHSSSYFVLDPDFFAEIITDVDSVSCLKMSYNPLNLNFGTIEGNAALDGDGDCVTDIDGRSLSYWKILFDDGNRSFLRTTKQDGSYQVALPAGNYTISLLPKNELYTVCSPPVSITLLEDQIVTDIDFVATPTQSCAILQTNVNASFFRRCFDNNIQVRYENIGTELAQNAKVAVILDDQMSLISASKPYFIQNDTLVFLIGDIQPDDFGFISLVVHIDCQSTFLGQTQCITSLGYPNQPCTIHPDYAGSNVIVTGECQNNQKIVFTIKNIGNGNMPTPLQYIVVEDDVMRPPVSYQLDVNQSLVVDMDADGKTYSLITQKEQNFPGLSRPRAFVEGCGTSMLSSGFVNNLPMDDNDPFIDILCLPNIGAYDPNDITGFATGVGIQKYIEKSDKLEYKIRFQNTGTDTAFNIVIRNDIAKELDISTFNLTIASHNFTYRFDDERQLVVTFSDIQLVDSFKNEPLSHGYLVYEIYPSQTLVDGDALLNLADIYFDFNTPIRTNVEYHTIGRPLFVSSVVAHDPKVRITAYPNPTSDRLVIDIDEIPNMQYTLYDGSGKIIDIGLYNHKEGIKCASLPTGIYMVNLTSQSKKIAFIKFVKK